jgi:hypothetical protein
VDAVTAHWHPDSQTHGRAVIMVITSLVLCCTLAGFAASPTSQDISDRAMPRFYAANRLTDHHVRGRPLISVDVDLGGRMDLDDIELVDPKSEETLTGVWMALPLSADGTLVPEGAHRGARWLLLFAPPSDLDSVWLRSWGQLLSEHPVEVVDGQLPAGGQEPLVDLSQVLWPFGRSHVAHHVDDWLVVRLFDAGAAMAVVDLSAARVEPVKWEVDVSDILPRKGGGWVTIEGRDVVFYPPGRPGSRPARRRVQAPDRLKSMARVSRSWLAWNDRHLYRVDGDRMVELAQTGASPGGLLGVEPHHGRLPVHDAVRCADGFAYLEDRAVFHRSRAGVTTPLFPELTHVMDIEPGPQGTLLLKLGENDQGWVVAQADLRDGWMRGLEASHFGPFIQDYTVSSVHYNQESDRLFVVTNDALFFFPEASWEPHDSRARQ